MSSRPTENRDRDERSREPSRTHRDNERARSTPGHSPETMDMPQRSSVSEELTAAQVDYSVPESHPHARPQQERWHSMALLWRNALISAEQSQGTICRQKENPAPTSPTCPDSSR